MCEGCEKYGIKNPTRVLDVVLLREGNPRVPTKAYAGDAGYDLATSRETVCEPQVVTDVPTGIKIALPDGYWGRITGRSSAFRRHGVLVLEGVIDTGYRGELFVGVYNPGITAKSFKVGDRLGQLIIHPIESVPIRVVAELSPSERGEKGFGSSG